MKARMAVWFFALPLAVHAGGCAGSSGSGLTCPLNPQCYVVASDGECSVDPSSVCSNGSWQCSSKGKLGSGCLPDGGIVPPPEDAGTCPLATLNPPLSCDYDSTCTPYGGHCVFPALNGPGECVCGSAVQDSGTNSDACTLDCYGDICSLPSFTITCNGANDTTTCALYNAVCIGSPGGGPQYVCECVAVDPPHGGATGN